MKVIKIIVFCIILLVFICNKLELFTNLSPKILSEYDMHQIKKAIDNVAYNEYLNAQTKIGNNYMKIIIDAFNESLVKKNVEKQKKAFESDELIKVIFNDEKLDLSKKFKESLFMEMDEAYLLNRNINMVPLRLYSENNIISKKNYKRITEKILSLEFKNISDFFILYLLKFYDISQKKTRFDRSLPTINELNKKIVDNLSLFFN